MSKIDQISQIKPKIKAIQIVKGLIVLIIPLWLGSYLYLLSNKPGLPFDLDAAQFRRKSTLTEQINLRASPYSADLVPAYKELCQISLCERDRQLAKNYLNALIRCTDDIPDTRERSNLYFFAANIFRDFKDFEEARKKYEDALLLLEAPAQKANAADIDLKIAQARILNNLGTTYFLQGKSESRSQCLRDYSLAEGYFAKAVKITVSRDNRLYKTVQTNLEQCLTEMSFLD